MHTAEQTTKKHTHRAQALVCVVRVVEGFCFSSSSFLLFLQRSFCHFGFWPFFNSAAVIFFGYHTVLNILLLALCVLCCLLQGYSASSSTVPVLLYRSIAQQQEEAEYTGGGCTILYYVIDVDKTVEPYDVLVPMRDLVQKENSHYSTYCILKLIFKLY